MIEFELETKHLALHNVSIVIPLPSGVEPSIEEPEAGVVEVSDDTIGWHIDEISQASGIVSGQLEVHVNEAAEDPDVFFPVAVDFVTPSTLCDIGVASVVSAESAQPIVYSTQSALSAENYVIN